MLLHTPEIAAHLFEHARDIVLVIDYASGHILAANLAATDAYQYTRAELCTKTIFDLRVDDPAPVATQMAHARSQGLLFETLHRRRDGSSFPVEVSSRGLVVDGEPRELLLSVIRDITVRKQLERDREQLVAATTHALAVRDEFLVVASHELRTPVTNISLQLQRLQRTLTREGIGTAATAIAAVTAVTAVTASLAEVRRLASLIDTLLDAQRTDSAIVLDRTDVDLAELMHSVAERLRPRAELAGSDLVVDVSQLRGHWDRLRLDQVLTNLVTNAIKYGRGRPIRMRGTPEEGLAAIEIADEGIGICDADRTRIFEKYERAVSPSYGGLGLGLYITRQLVEAHGGTIEVRPNGDEGSTFRVTLPLG